MKPFIFSSLYLAMASVVGLSADEPVSLIYSGVYENGTFNNLDFVNSVVGWDTFFNAGYRGASTVIANIEAGHVWAGHEVFVRAPDATNGVTNFVSAEPGLTNELDFHATWSAMCLQEAVTCLRMEVPTPTWGLEWLPKRH